MFQAGGVFKGSHNYYQLWPITQLGQCLYLVLEQLSMYVESSLGQTNIFVVFVFLQQVFEKCLFVFQYSYCCDATRVSQVRGQPVNLLPVKLTNNCLCFKCRVLYGYIQSAKGQIFNTFYAVLVLKRLKFLRLIFFNFVHFIYCLFTTYNDQRLVLMDCFHVYSTKCQKILSSEGALEL